MARPLRFRHAPGRWTEGRVRHDVYSHLDSNLGATMRRPWFKPPSGYEARRFEMDNGDTALFCWNDDGAYWLGNTETPSTLWRTDKFGFTEVPYRVRRWAERELLAQLHEETPWLEPFPHLSWFFLPVFLSKDGRHTTRQFFDEHAAGFPDATRDEALSFYEEFLSTGVLDEYRELMAGKLGTSKQLDLVRMSASMGEFNAAALLTEAGYDITPEIEVTTGHSLDYRAERNGDGTLVEVTRPLPTDRRSAGTPVAAVRDTAETKTSGQLERHGGGVTLFVDCSSFPDDDWASVRGEKPDVRHRPAVVFRTRPSGRVEAYRKGSVPLDLDGAVEWV
ncbi:hypothetical protein AUR64_01310 [Haloprofundus marisrubri]|uniref:Uncharacterized protein n=1 Tax=Haloprofundus marisrubri TaxID=1514971 RepID=A0A0W1R3G7_9EURY|nr:DUF5784 family protein [Haloprofundus marisrubri]KTG07902.1 hypothetical protein AUR64_01310 [Haloprofundus marisrubri]